MVTKKFETNQPGSPSDPLDKSAKMIDSEGSSSDVTESAGDAVEAKESEEGFVSEERDNSNSETQSEFDYSNATGFLSMLSNLMLPKALTQRKASYTTGVDDWAPSDPEQIAVLSDELFHKYKKVHPHVGADMNKNGSFSVVTKIETESLSTKTLKKTEVTSKSWPNDTNDMESVMERLVKEPEDSQSDKLLNSSKEEHPDSLPPDEQPPPVHHLIITFWGKDEKKNHFSLYRSRKVTNVVALCERSRECCELFRLNPKGEEKSVYISRLLVCLKENLLWRSIHVAACLGIIEYFRESTHHRIKSCMYHQTPEGYTALQVAVRFNRLEVVKILVDLGADLNTISTNAENCMHLAATTSPEMIKYLWSTGKFASSLNAPNADGCSPLYLAVRSATPYCARALINCGAALTACSPDNSPRPLIDAMKRGKLDAPMLDLILERSPNSLTETDSVTGNTPLHCAAYKKPLLVLLDKKISELHLDVRNNVMMTPLHVYVKKNDLSLVMAICAYDVDINAKDVNGSTPLHLAVINLNLEIVRFLLCIGADTNFVNNHKETARHLAARFKNNEVARQIVRSLIICGARTCPADFIGCTVACVHKDNFIGETPPSFIEKNHSVSSNLNDGSKTEDSKVRELTVDYNAPTGPYEFELDPDSHQVDESYKNPTPARSYPQDLAVERVMQKLKAFAEAKKKGSDDSGQNIISVLCLDGGGIKGLVMTQVLLILQQHLDRPIFEYFDWIGATSTGALILSTILAGHNLYAAQKMYLRFKDMVFDSWTRPYNTMILEKFYKKAFTENMLMSDISYPKLFYTTVRADTFPVQLELTRNYQLPLSAEENEELGFSNPRNVRLWEAARRSSAAPTFFSAAEDKYIDGGMVSNNPTLELLSEVHFWNSTCEMNGKNELMVELGCVVSLGTGITPISPVDPSLFEMNDLLGMLRGLKNLSLVVLDQATATEGAPISRSRSWSHSLGIPFFRLNAPLFKDILLDCNEDSELTKMMWNAIVYGHTHRKDFIDLANLLKAIGSTKERKKRFGVQLAQIHTSSQDDDSSSSHIP